ncbi:MAG TPA: DUF4118 domain-containing protein [Acidimicrobiia bacterium]
MRSSRGLFESAVPGYVIGGLGPIGVAAALVPVRNEVDNTNLALALVVVVVAAALAGGRGPAVVGAVVAAMSYDFFLTKPYLSLSIASADDVETTIFLLVIGLLVGELVAQFRRTRSAAERGASEIARLHRVAELAASGMPADELERAVQEELIALLDLRDCFFEPAPVGHPLPRMERNGAISGAAQWKFTGEEFALPAEVELPVLGRGRQVGRFVLVSSPRAGASLEERTVAVALSDQLGAVLAGEGMSFRSPEEL